MIIRHIARRQGRPLFRAGTSQSRAWPRTYASDLDRIDLVEKSMENHVLETQSIESSLQGHSSQPIPRFSGLTHQQIDPETAKIAQKYRILKEQKQNIGRYGADVGPVYDPSEVLNNPPRPDELTPELLLASQAHLGHSTSLWNPMNSRFIYGVRDGIHIIALEETLAHLRRACRVVRGVAERGGLMLFVGTRKGQARAIVNAAERAGACHLFEKWTPGSITNGNQILGSLRKKIVDINDEEISVSEDSLRNVPALKPDLVVCLNPLENWVLLNECALHNIPTIGLIDTDADPTWVTYPIPANDDSLRCTNLIAGVIGRAGEGGRKQRLRMGRKGKALYDELELPSNTVLSPPHKMHLRTDAVKSVQWLDENGRELDEEEIEKMQNEGYFVDDSMLTYYNDEDGGDPTATEVLSIDPNTGRAARELTEAGGAPTDGSAYQPGFTKESMEQLLESTSTSKDPLNAVIAEQEGSEELSASELASLSKLTEIEADIAGLRGEVDDLSGTMSSSASSSPGSVTKDAELEAELRQLAIDEGLENETVQEQEEVGTENQATSDDAQARSQQQHRGSKLAADPTEQLREAEEKERIEAAKPKPDDKRQAKLDAEKKDKSH